MIPKRICAVYFSPNGTTEKVVSTIAKEISLCFGVVTDNFDFTRAKDRMTPLTFYENDLIIFGVPVYAGRVPNLLLKFIKSTQAEKGCLVVPIVLFGNRSYDNALLELSDLLEECGMQTIAAGAYVGQHAFSNKIAQGRPNQDDINEIQDFGRKIAAKAYYTQDSTGTDTAIDIKGEPGPHYGGYFKPLNPKDNTPIDIRKAKPVTSDACIACGICAENCSMGSINHSNPKEVIGICIKCGACINHCPISAKSFIDQGYLTHKEDLEHKLSTACENETFI